MNHANFAQGTLAAAVTDTTGTSITVASSTGFPATPFIISIDTEAFLVGTVAGTTWTVTRGYEGSTAATHLNGAAIYHDLSAAEADAIATKLPLAGGTMTGPLNMDNMDITFVKLLTLHGEIDDGNSGVADTIDWNAGAAHKSTLTGNATLAFTGYGSDIVPTMTSDTAPSGVASADTDSVNAWKAFDTDTGTYWTSGAGHYIQYQFPVAHTILLYGLFNALYLGSYGYHFNQWKLEGSNNGTDWTVVDSRTGQSTTYNAASYWTVTTPGNYLYYRWTLIASEGSAGYLGELYLVETASTDPVAPCFLTLKLVQDATGGRVVTWPATVKGTPAINLAANAVSNVLFYWDGTNYWTLNGKQFASATDKLIGRSTAGAGELEEIACTAAGRALLDDANASAQIATLGLDADIATFALPANTTISAAGAELINDADAEAQRATLGTAAYTEGTWTPRLTFGGLSVGITYGANNRGQYTKIGRQVTVAFFLQLTNKGSSTGNALLTGLPFAAGTSEALGALLSSKILFTNQIALLVNPSVSYVTFYDMSANGSYVAIYDGAFSNDSFAVGTLSYFV